MKNIFTSHPHAIGESYLKHFAFACITGLKLILWGIVAIIHGFFPFAFKTYVSSRIKKLYFRIHQR